ncbi:MAG: DUF4160 domain-containing protein [Chitinophagaceae bacterium]|jgi:hypothetical protein|nr:DUF4160 domain-containing protein [Chitinophagaceae bacterium]
MPTIVYIDGYRFFFYSNDHLPIHIHVEKGNATAKYELEPVLLVKSRKFTAKELNEIRNLVEENRHLFIQKWNEFFNH